MLIFHVGTYEKDGGRGLVPVSVGKDGALAAGEPFADAPNASFAAQSHGIAYMVDEQDEGAVTVARREEAGWRRLARAPTRGKAPCHVALDRNGSRLAIANYGSGSVTLYALDGEGLPIEPPALFQGHGKGPNEERQEGPHAHCVRFSHGGEGLYMVDLGADRIECLTLGKGALFVEAMTAWQAPPGSGPRHLVFHPRRPLALVLSELASTVTLLDLHDGRMRARQTLSTLPAGFAGENLGGHLELSADGRRVYASNRGHNSIAVFGFDGDRLEPVAHVPSGGAHPRHFLLLEDESLIAVAHEKDGRVTLLEIAEGTLRAKGAGVTVAGACFLLR